MKDLGPSELGLCGPSRIRISGDNIVIDVYGPSQCGGCGFFRPKLAILPEGVQVKPRKADLELDKVLVF